MDNVLLIGNSQDILKNSYGDRIDSSGMYVVRFNKCKTAGFEKKVGTRTDMHVLCGGIYARNGSVNISCPNLAAAESRLGGGVYRDTMDKRHQLTRKNKAKLIIEDLSQKFGYEGRSSSGLLTIFHFLEQGKTVYLYGFSFCQSNYFGNSKGCSPHDWAAEKRVVEKLVAEGRVRWFE